jgi:ribosome maturation factor RimP
MAASLEKIRAVADRVAASLGLEILDVEWQVGKQRLLRVFIDREPTAENPGGGLISHNDCQQVSEQLNVILDVEELVTGSPYVLEVSSPGLDRKLLKPRDYERFSGRLVRIWLAQPIAGEGFFEGRLTGFSDGKVLIAVGQRQVELPFSGIRKANLAVEF